MEMRETSYKSLMGQLPKRIVDQAVDVDLDGRYWMGQDRGHTVVIRDDQGDERGCMAQMSVGVATKSAQDKFDPQIGLRIAAVRCLRSAGLLPEAKRQRRHKKSSELDIQRAIMTSIDEYIQHYPPSDRFF